MPETQGTFSWDEIIEKFPEVILLVNTIAKGVKDANLDGKVTGAEMGDLLALVSPKIGRLVDAVIVDLQD
jgi:fumarylacetoacetate (FAA) hydrolase family protein